MLCDFTNSMSAFMGLCLRREDELCLPSWTSSHLDRGSLELNHRDHCALGHIPCQDQSHYVEVSSGWFFVPNLFSIFRMMAVYCVLLENLQCSNTFYSLLEICVLVHYCLWNVFDVIHSILRWLFDVINAIFYLNLQLSPYHTLPFSFYSEPSIWSLYLHICWMLLPWFFIISRIMIT